MLCMYIITCTPSPSGEPVVSLSTHCSFGSAGFLRAPEKKPGSPVSSAREGVEEAAACLGVMAAATRASSLLHLEGYTSQPGWRQGAGKSNGQVKETTHKQRGVRECDLSGVTKSDSGIGGE